MARCRGSLGRKVRQTDGSSVDGSAGLRQGEKITDAATFSVLRLLCPVNLSVTLLSSNLCCLCGPCLTCTHSPSGYLFLRFKVTVSLRPSLSSTDRVTPTTLPFQVLRYFPLRLFSPFSYHPSSYPALWWTLCWFRDTWGFVAVAIRGQIRWGVG